MSNGFSSLYVYNSGELTDYEIVFQLPNEHRFRFAMYIESSKIAQDETKNVLAPILKSFLSFDRQYESTLQRFLHYTCEKIGMRKDYFDYNSGEDCVMRIVTCLDFCCSNPPSVSDSKPYYRLAQFRSTGDVFFNTHRIGVDIAWYESSVEQILETKLLKYLLFDPSVLQKYEDYFTNKRKQQRFKEPEQYQTSPPKYKDGEASVISVTKKRKTTNDKESPLHTFKGIDLLLQLADIKTRSGLTYDAFVDWLNEQHEKIGNNGISGPFYRKILGLKKITELSTSSPIDIMEKLPVFAHIFIFFLKCTGKFDVTIVPDKKVNELTFIDLASLDETKIADIMFSNVFREFSVFDLAGLNTHEFEELLSKLDEADSTFIEKFWNTFKNQGVNQAVINAQKSCSNFMVRYFKELKSEEKLDKIAELNLELMKLIFSANGTNAFNSQSAQCFPWITAADAVNALAKPVVKNSLPKPNIDKAKEQINEVVDITNPLAITILDWLKTTKTCELSTKLAKLNLNIEQISEVFAQIGAEYVEDFGELIEDEETVKAIKSELEKCGVKLLQTMLIINALKEEIKRSKNM